MKREVMITIDGRQEGDEEAIVVSVPGIYHFTNKVHYVQYKDQESDGGMSIENMLRITLEQVVLMKKGPQTSKMIFNPKEITQTVYQTPYGALSLDIQTSLLEVKEQIDRIEVNLRYSLSEGERELSKNGLRIRIE
ncbi:MAG: DUF1934 domain-containing protein [Mobilitalea sp.]